MIGLFLQGFQIDIDHWRFVFFLLGAVWGLDASRRRWLDQAPALSSPLSRRAAPASSRSRPVGAP